MRRSEAKLRSCSYGSKHAPSGYSPQELLTAELNRGSRVATPANWHQGDDVIITGAVSNEEADKIFPGYKTVKPYLRTTPQPQSV